MRQFASLESNCALHYKRIATALFVLSGLLIGPNVAIGQSGLPASMITYGSTFETNDYGVSPDSCENTDVLTSACSCPGALPISQEFRIVNDASGPGNHTGGYINACQASTSSTEVYAGAYQEDDPVSGGYGCRYSNPITGACSCPSGTTAVATRVITTSSTDTLIGSHVTFCVRTSAALTAFGGVYQHDDNVTGGLGCRADNPITGTCSCPTGFLTQSMRVQVDVSSGGYIGSTIYGCSQSVPSTEICSGQYADPTGATSAFTAMQNCINSAAGKFFELPVGSYQIDNQLVINYSNTVIQSLGVSGTSGICMDSIPCATLLAAPDLNVPLGFLYANSKSGITVDHIILDGNRSGRLNTSSYNECASGVAANREYGFNAVFSACTSCQLSNSVSENAQCGTGFQWSGDNAEILYNSFLSNGNHETANLWSDGLTLVSSANATVTGNYFLNNTDVSFIVGNAPNASITGNRIQQPQERAFAGFVLFNFGTTGPGNFVGATISSNTIECTQCDYGVNLGPNAWNTSVGNTSGGLFENNTVSGGYITLNIDGAGTAANPVVISNNNLGAYYTPFNGGFCVDDVRYNVWTVASYVNGPTPDAQEDTNLCH